MAAKYAEATEFVEWLMQRLDAETPAELARRVGMPDTTVHRWHRGENRPNFTDAMRMMRAAGVLNSDAPVRGPRSLDDVYERIGEVLGRVAALEQPAAVRRLIVKWHFGRGDSLAEIAAELDTTEDAVAGLLEEALAVMAPEDRAALESGRLGAAQAESPSDPAFREAPGERRGTPPAHAQPDADPVEDPDALP